jgi:2-keto-4-pentenoate hydratase/2-oxohepta-3-ene-1,7-dioic acid hydratase in catechol pathway
MAGGATNGEKMKLLRYGDKGSEKPGLLDDKGSIRDLSGFVTDLEGEVLSEEGLEGLEKLDLTSLPIVEGEARIGPCVGRIGKFICIGLNYADHAAESGMDVPKEPVVFFKATSAVSGPFDNVEIPPESIRTDWEVELGVVIGKYAKHVPEDQTLEHVAGYCVVNDLSEREYQLEMGGQWVKGKSYDTFGPIGPYLVTKSEVPDPQKLRLWLEVDGKRYQDGSTETMVFGVTYLVSYLSRFMSLHPGDIISTGTPPGVGLGQKPHPVYLKPGQTMRLGIEGLGIQEQRTITRSGALRS